MSGRIEREKEDHDRRKGDGREGRGTVVERSVARAREYRATVAVGTPTTQAMTSRDASAATSARSTTAFRTAARCIPGPAGIFLIPV